MGLPTEHALHIHTYEDIPNRLLASSMSSTETVLVGGKSQGRGVLPNGAMICFVSVQAVSSHRADCSVTAPVHYSDSSVCCGAGTLQVMFRKVPLNLMACKIKSILCLSHVHLYKHTLLGRLKEEETDSDKWLFFLFNSFKLASNCFAWGFFDSIAYNAVVRLVLKNNNWTMLLMLRDSSPKNFSSHKHIRCIQKTWNMSRINHIFMVCFVLFRTVFTFVFHLRNKLHTGTVSGWHKG